MRRVRVTLPLRSGPGVLNAVEFGVPGLVLHGEVTGRDAGGRARQRRSTHVITHLASGCTVGRRWLPQLGCLAATARRARALYGPLDWTVPAEAIVADARYHAIVREFECRSGEEDV